MTNLVLNSLNELTKVAQKIIDELDLKNNHTAINCLAFYGEMGAGKTTLIKAFCQVLGVEDVVSSPTFSLVNVYNDKDGRNVFHFDFYRIKKLEEVYDIGYEEYFYSGDYCLIEWPEMVRQIMPESYVLVTIEIDDSENRVINCKLVK